MISLNDPKPINPDSVYQQIRHSTSLTGVMDYLICQICSNVAENAVETHCCQVVYCESCLSPLAGKPCPKCQNKSLSFEASLMARRMIGAIETECPYGCGLNMPRTELDTHMAACLKKTIECASKDCGFKGLKDEFMEHLMKTHQEEIAEKFSKAPNVDKTAFNPSQTIVNSRGFPARIGSVPKYYCGNKTEVHCGCTCDGLCGSGDGCNCAACMELDLKARGLGKNCLVNKDGFTAMLIDSKFYCGRKLKSVFHGSSNCEPTATTNCIACKSLDTSAKGLYKKFL